jgi:hypothetical protein
VLDVDADPVPAQGSTPIPQRATALSSKALDSLPPINDIALAANRAYRA